MNVKRGCETIVGSSAQLVHEDDADSGLQDKAQVVGRQEGQIPTEEA